MKRTPSSMRPTAAFTLVELLSVIAIICLLLALLIPAVRYGVGQAQATACLNNLHQIGTASTVFYGDYKRLPVAGVLRSNDPGGSPDLGEYPSYSDGTAMRPLPYQAALAYYLDKKVRTDSRANLQADIQLKELSSIFTCRAQRDIPTNVQMLNYQGVEAPTGTSSYGFNEAVMGYWYTGAERFTRALGVLARVDSPVDTVLYADAKPRTEWPDPFVAFFNGYDSMGGQDSTLWDCYGTWSNGRSGTPSLFDLDRHRKRMNMVFVDGHAAGTNMVKENLEKINLSRGVHRWGM